MMTMCDLPLRLVDRRSTAQSSQRRIITPAQGARALAQQCREIDSANAGHRSEDHDVLSLKALSRVSIGLADRRAQRIKLGVGLPQFAVDDTQPGKQRTQMNAGCSLATPCQL